MIQVSLPGKGNIINAYGATTEVYLLTGEEKMQGKSHMLYVEKKVRRSRYYENDAPRAKTRKVIPHMQTTKRKSSTTAVPGCLRGPGNW